VSTLQAKFTQSPSENLRYVLNYTLFLAPTESIVAVASVVQQNAGFATPPLVITGLNVIAGIGTAPATTAAYFASGGVDQGVYEVQFLATTSLGQILEDIVLYTLAEKL
jgi:hypothetical protein